MIKRIRDLSRTPFGIGILLAYFEIFSNCAGLLIDFAISLHDDWASLGHDPLFYSIIFGSLIFTLLGSVSMFFFNYKAHQAYNSLGFRELEELVLKVHESGKDFKID